MSFPKKVKLVEVGPRDGLQNEVVNLSTDIKIEFINQLNKTGLTAIEVGSLVSAKWVPQMADSATVFQIIEKKPDISYPLLVPNNKGLTTALAIDAKEIAIFAAASETFSQKNINCSIAESLNRFADITTVAKKHNIKIRAYISCVLGCPYEGEIKSETVVYVAEKLIHMGCYEISLGDTIGVGTPLKAQQLIEMLSKKIPTEQLAVHFHDTYGQALANIFAALEKGIAVIDSSVAGLGGCPYAKGASGNVATEDVLYMLDGMGIATGVNLTRLIDVGQFICRHLNKKPQSKVSLARSQ